MFFDKNKNNFIKNKIPLEEYINIIQSYISTLNGNDNFVKLGNLIKLNTNGKILIIGDLHGDIKSLDYILNTNINLLEDKKNIIVSLGDLIDRGEDSLGVIYRLASLGVKYPGQVVILKGNHEISNLGEIYPFDFDKELYFRYGNYYGKFLLDFTINNFFNKLPIAAYIENDIFFVHGGIPIQVPSLEEISKSDLEDSINRQLRWNDPTESVDTYIPSNRGTGIYLFGYKITEKFLEKTNLKKL